MLNIDRSIMGIFFLLIFNYTASCDKGGKRGTTSNKCSGSGID